MGSPAAQQPGALAPVPVYPSTLDKCKDVLLALSLASLSYSVAWQRIIFGTPLLMPRWTWRDPAALALNVAWLSLVFWSLIYFSRRLRWTRVQLHALLFLIPGAIMLNLLRQLNLRPAKVVASNPHQVLFAFAMGATVFVYAVSKWGSKLVPVIELVIMAMVATLPLNFAQAVAVVLRQPPRPRLAVALPPNSGPRARVVWIIFDETDLGLAFLHRPTDLRLPQMDRLRSQSLFAQNAYEADTETQEAMPSLTTGKQVVRSEPHGPNQLLIAFPGSQKPVDWGAQINVFAAARELGFNVGIVGWYLPYCRIFATVLTSCYWVSGNTEVLGFQPDFWWSVAFQLESLNPLGSRQMQIRRYDMLMKKSRELISDDRLGLVLLHLPVPHGPAVYDRRSGHMTWSNLKSNWYFDNLALMDRALGEIRTTMERSGGWDKTTVIVTSDHSLRLFTMPHDYDPRVPFMVKLAGQEDSVNYSEPFNSRITKDLILAVLKGDITHPGDLQVWLHRVEHQ